MTEVTAGEPVDTLARAISLIRGAAANATSGPWVARLENVNTFPQGGRDHWYAGDVAPDVVTGSEWPVCELGNTRWIALMCPEILAPALDAWLRHALDVWQASTRKDSPRPSASDQSALAFARDLLDHAQRHVAHQPRPHASHAPRERNTDSG